MNKVLDSVWFTQMGGRCIGIVNGQLRRSRRVDRPHTPDRSNEMFCVF